MARDDDKAHYNEDLYRLQRKAQGVLGGDFTTGAGRRGGHPGKTGTPPLINRSTGTGAPRNVGSRPPGGGQPSTPPAPPTGGRRGTRNPVADQTAPAPKPKPTGTGTKPKPRPGGASYGMMLSDRKGGAQKPGAVGPAKPAQRGTGIPGVRKNITDGVPSYTNLPPGQKAQYAGSATADPAAVLQGLRSQREYLQQLNAERAGPGPRATLIGGQRQESDLESAIKDAIDRSRPRGTGRNELLRAKAGRQQLAALTDQYQAQEGNATSRANTQAQAEAALQERQLANQGVLSRQQLANQGAIGAIDARSAADYDQLLAQAGIDRDLAEFEGNLPLNRARANFYEQRANLLPDELRAEQDRALYQMNLDAQGARNQLIGDVDPLTLSEEGRNAYERYILNSLAGYADGGMVMGMPDTTLGYAGGGMVIDMPQGVLGYADGGPIGFDSQPNMESLDPAIREYSQYVSTATKHDLQPVPFGKFVDLMEAGKQSLQSYPTTGGTMGFADGGAIPVAGQQVLDETMMPDMEGSDDIPAVIDGSQPAALTSGEYVIPAEVVKAKGTEFFDKLIAQYVQPGE